MRRINFNLLVLFVQEGAKRDREVIMSKEIKTIGIGIKINWRLLRTENGIGFQIRYLKSSYLRNSSMKDMEQMKERVGALILNAPYLKENLFNYLHNLHFTSTIRIGLGDAAQTALICGLLSQC